MVRDRSNNATRLSVLQPTFGANLYSSVKMSVADTNKGAENGTFEFPYMKPPEEKTIKDAVWDPETKEVLGRTGKNWAQLLLFYTTFYAVLAAFFAICMKGFLATLDDKTPRWILSSSLIGTNPGISLQPTSPMLGPVISYNTTDETTILEWARLLDSFLLPYKNTTAGVYKNRVYCDFNEFPKEGETCIVDLDAFADCRPENFYGYNSSSPCVFLKLNKIYGWVPDLYDDPENLPEDMPADLVEDIKYNANSKEKLKQVWVSCIGKNPVDKKHVHTFFKYYPTRGFPSYFYPYTNEPGYLSPLIAVRIMNPKPNVPIIVECRAWAKNIFYRGSNLQREGSTLFGIMLYV